MQADWTSMLVNTEILNIILSTYGYDVEKVIADDSARYPGFETGDLTLAVETWQTTQDKAFTASVGTGKVLDMGELGPHEREDWWYPAYMADLCPGLAEPGSAEELCRGVFGPRDRAEGPLSGRSGQPGQL